jgi:hypothetical protein
MSQEQNFDLIAWWKEQSFDGKELFELDEQGAIILKAHSNVKERTIANIDAETAEAVVKTLCEKYDQVKARVKEMEVEWLATEDKLKVADKVGHLKEYLQTVAALGNFAQPAALVHDWEHTIYTIQEENYAAKLKLTEVAESLANSDQWKETTQAFKDITEQWKHTGYVNKSRTDKLWNRIESAKQQFYDRKRAHHEDEEKDLLQNLDLKIDLVEQAETLAASTEWKKTADAFHRLTAEWKTIGHTLNKKNEELWQRFMAAKSAFFDKKKEHTSQVQEEQDKNYEVKMALVEKAEAMQHSTDWSATSQAYAALMEEWKKTGRVPHQKSDEIWKRFTDAQEMFFDAKRAHTDKIRAEQDQNYEKKKALLERAEYLKNSNHWGEATAEMVTLLEDWKKIGMIPREYGDKLWESFNAARKHFFARKDANREQRKQYYEAHKTARIEQIKNMVPQLRKEIKEEEEKLIDFKHALDNITPGKKAEELRLHLTTLIADCNAKIKRLYEKHEAAKVEADIIDSKENEENVESSEAESAGS